MCSAPAEEQRTTCFSYSRFYDSFPALPFLSLLHNSWCFSLTCSEASPFPWIPIFHGFHFFLFARTKRGRSVGTSGCDAQTTSGCSRSTSALKRRLGPEARHALRSARDQPTRVEVTVQCEERRFIPLKGSVSAWRSLAVVPGFTRLPVSLLPVFHVPACDEAQPPPEQRSRDTCAAETHAQPNDLEGLN